MSTEAEKVWECKKCGYVIEHDGKLLHYDPALGLVDITHIGCGGKFVQKDLKDVSVCN